MHVSVFSFSSKDNSSKMFFVEELNWGGGTHEYYKNTTKIEPQEILMIPKFSLQYNFHSVCCLVAPRKLMFIELQYR